MFEVILWRLHKLQQIMRVFLQVNIVDSAEGNAYVRGFDGLVTAKSERDTVQRLASDLDSVGANYDKSFYYVATYGR